MSEIKEPSAGPLEIYKSANESLRKLSARLEREVWALRSQNAKLDAENRELRHENACRELPATRNFDP